MQQKALEFYNNSAELDPLNKQALIAKGILLKKMGKMEEAEASLKEAFKVDSSD